MFREDQSSAVSLKISLLAKLWLCFLNFISLFKWSYRSQITNLVVVANMNIFLLFVSNLGKASGHLEFFTVVFLVVFWSLCILVAVTLKGGGDQLEAENVGVPPVLMLINLRRVILAAVAKSAAPAHFDNNCGIGEICAFGGSPCAPGA